MITKLASASLSTYGKIITVSTKSLTVLEYTSIVCILSAIIFVCVFSQEQFV
jgi:hypothetical protein